MLLVRYKVTEVKLHVYSLLGMKPYSLIEGYQRFGGKYCFHPELDSNQMKIREKQREKLNL
jgi:hypothetical protein